MVLAAVRFSLLLAAIAVIGAVECYAQADASSAEPGRRTTREMDMPKGFHEMRAKQRLERERKEHEEMLARGEEALLLTKQLENSFAQSEQFTSQDRKNLESLEKLVSKIRKDLGGRDDDEEDAEATAPEAKPSTLKEAFKYLQSSTVKLVDELKKTTQYSISAIAIQTSNSVLKIVRFLRFRK